MTVLSSLFKHVSEQEDGIIGILRRYEAPYDAEIEYLESNNGLQYIDTEIDTNDIADNGRFFLKIKLFSLKCRFMGYASGSAASPGDITLATANSNRADIPYCYSGWKDSTIQNFDCLQEEPYTLNFEFQSGYQKLYIDGILKKSSSLNWNSGSSIKRHILLFRAQNDVLKSSRFYFCQIYHGDEILRDFIPVRVKQIGYMYDKVSKQLFENAGTGSFILGPDKV